MFGRKSREIIRLESALAERDRTIEDQKKQINNLHISHPAFEAARMAVNRMMSGDNALSFDDIECKAEEAARETLESQIRHELLMEEVRKLLDSDFAELVRAELSEEGHHEQMEPLLLVARSIGSRKQKKNKRDEGPKQARAERMARSVANDGIIGFDEFRDRDEIVVKYYRNGAVAKGRIERNGLIRVSGESKRTVNLSLYDAEAGLAQVTYDSWSQSGSREKRRLAIPEDLLVSCGVKITTGTGIDILDPIIRRGSNLSLFHGGNDFTIPELEVAAVNFADMEVM